MADFDYLNLLFHTLGGAAHGDRAVALNVQLAVMTLIDVGYYGNVCCLLW